MNTFYFIKKFVAITLSIVACFAIISFAAILSYNFSATEVKVAASQDLGNVATNSQSNINQNPLPVQLLPQAPIATNILLLGFDEGGGLPDTVLVLTYDSVSNMLDIISIPRDTALIPTTQEAQKARELGLRNMPSNNLPIKINELHSIMGNTYGYRFLQNRIGTMLGIEFDYYVHLDLDAFRYIVDAVGGIYMDIRQGGLEYSDPYQNLFINLPEGRHLLDGQMAEHFVRFRDFRGDLGRIDNQQAFMSAFFSQVLARENIMSNIMPLFNSFVQFVRTDFGLLSALRFAPAALSLNTENIGFHTLEGTARSTQHAFGHRSNFFFVDEVYAIGLIDRIRSENNKQLTVATDSDSNI